MSGRGRPCLDAPSERLDGGVLPVGLDPPRGPGLDPWPDGGRGGFAITRRRGALGDDFERPAVLAGGSFSRRVGRDRLDVLWSKVDWAAGVVVGLGNDPVPPNGPVHRSLPGPRRDNP